MGRTTGQLAFQISLPPNVATTIADRIPGEELTAIDKLASVAEGLMEQLAEGGIMLSAADVERLSETGHEVADAEDIVKMAESAVNFDQGQYVFRAVIDPANMPPLEELAKSNGISVEQMATDMLNYGIEQDWLYEVPPGYKSVRLTPEQNRMIAAMIGVPDFNGVHLEKFLREKILGIVEEEMPFAESDDPAPAAPQVPEVVGAEK